MLRGTRPLGVGWTAQLACSRARLSDSTAIRCPLSLFKLCVQIRNQLAFQPGDLILEHQFAFLHAPQLHFVHIEVHLQAVDDIIEIAMLDAQLPQPFEAPESLVSTLLSSDSLIAAYFS